MRPPAEKIYVGGGDFDQIGSQWVDYFVNECALQRSDAVLDVGCGIGRVAIPLTTYLTAGRYEGFDVNRDGIEWCQQHVSPVAPNFRFVLADIFNGKYNPSGTVQPADFRFPYEDATFDFAFLTSVFTHLLPADVVHYTAELSRVLKQGGRVMISAFLLNDHSLGKLDRGETNYGFDFDHGIFRANQESAEEGLAYDEEWFLRTLAALDLHAAHVHYGSWAGGESPNRDYQDAVLATKSP